VLPLKRTLPPGLAKILPEGERFLGVSSVPALKAFFIVAHIVIADRSAMLAINLQGLFLHPWAANCSLLNKTVRQEMGSLPDCLKAIAGCDQKL
jgi:hypothetical protein